jgi:hypothetical protein
MVAKQGELLQTFYGCTLLSNIVTVSHFRPNIMFANEARSLLYALSVTFSLA